MSLTIAVLRETADGERRVALDPAAVNKLTEAGHTVRIQSDAGDQAGFNDDAYREQGADIRPSAEDTLDGADVYLWVQPPETARLQQLRAGALGVGLAMVHRHPDLLKALEAGQLHCLAMELVPRITRAQSMDVLSSQATVAGYAAALRAASVSPKLFPMLTTAAGTLRPSAVIVIGAGVAGLQAIATARRLGARVQAYDIRAAAREQVESLGARMIDTGVDAESEGGYARELTAEEKQQQADALAEHLSKADAVISTAAIPGRPAPKIISREMVEGMQAGSLIVDLAAESGGNCELTEPGRTIRHGGVTVDGPLDLASTAATHASQMYARNVLNMLELVIREGELHIDREDEVVAGTLLTERGRLVHPKVERPEGAAPPPDSDDSKGAS